MATMMITANLSDLRRVMAHCREPRRDAAHQSQRPQKGTLESRCAARPFVLTKTTWSILRPAHRERRPACAIVCKTHCSFL
jgi:hypothetical protein